MILVDAPCSGEGMFRTEIALGEWSESNTQHCSDRQRRILSDVWPALKENGILVYSTCTFNPGENEENIKWLCEIRKAETLSLDISGYKGISEIDFNGIKGYGFYPDKIRGEGFFVSVIRKNDHQETVNYRGRRTMDFKPSTGESGAVRDWTNIPPERYLKWGDDIWGLPCDLNEYDRLFQNLRIIKAGTKICTVKKNDFLPSHELSLSSQLNSKAFPFAEIDPEDAVAFLRRDNIRTEINAMGWNIIRYIDVNLGWVKNIGSRLNNYYPVEWRIRMELPPADEIIMIKWE
jgi:NOL1/NOP2/fmu family ribosome biogenesis protein